MLAIDIIFFIAITAFIAWRLYQVLGTRTGMEKRPEDHPVFGQRPAPETKVRPAQESPDPESTGVQRSLAGSLTQMKILDPNFSEARFLRGAKAAFEMILKAYASGDTATLEKLLDADVLAGFKRAIKSRQDKGHQLETTLVRLRDPDILSVEVKGAEVYITVDFRSEQITFLRADDGSVLDGDPDRIFDIEDIWVFRRNMQSNDPTWFLHKTDTPDAP